MSILETITSLNQEASAARASTETSNPKNNEKVSKKLSSQQSVDGSTDKERNAEDLPDREKATCDLSGEGAETLAKCEDLNELPCQSEEIKNSAKDANTLTFTSKDTQQESEDVKGKLLDKSDKKPDNSEKSERRKEKKERLDKKSDHSKKSDDTTKSREEKQAKESEPVKQLVPEKNSNKHKTAESTKENKEGMVRAMLFLKIRIRSEVLKFIQEFNLNIWNQYICNVSFLLVVANLSAGNNWTWSISLN